MTKTSICGIPLGHTGEYTCRVQLEGKNRYCGNAEYHRYFMVLFCNDNEGYDLQKLMIRYDESSIMDILLNHIPKPFKTPGEYGVYLFEKYDPDKSPKRRGRDVPLKTYLHQLYNKPTDWPLKQEVKGWKRDVRRLNYDKRKDKAPGFIYVLQLEGDHPNFFKIGYTKDMKTRTRDWTSILAPYGKVKVIHTWETAPVGARYVERCIHLAFAPWRLARYLIAERGQIYTEGFWNKSQQGIPESKLDLTVKIPRIRSRKREVEWFYLPADQLREVSQWIIDKVKE